MCKLAQWITAHCATDYFAIIVQANNQSTAQPASLSKQATSWEPETIAK